MWLEFWSLQNTVQNNFKNKRALSISEAASYACVGRSTIENWIVQRLLPSEIFPGRGNGTQKFKRIRKADLDTFLDSCYQSAEKTKPEKKRKPLELLPREHVNK